LLNGIVGRRSNDEVKRKATDDRVGKKKMEWSARGWIAAPHQNISPRLTFNLPAGVRQPIVDLHDPVYL
jgi:hypothetical protein